MPTTPCDAPPGYFCSPLYNRPVICPENWYCAGGDAVSRKCLDGRWSAVGSIYPEDCTDHVSFNMAVLLMLFFMLLIVFTCIWYASWDSVAMNTGSYPFHEVVYAPATQYGTRQPHVILVKPDRGLYERTQI